MRSRSCERRTRRCTATTPTSCSSPRSPLPGPRSPAPFTSGGLGFGFKWNMGWMNDTLEYFSKDPVHRRWHHHELTFSLLYAFHENFMLPLSHDEVSHGKRSMLSKMPGDRWQQFANLRALYGWMWAHPGRQLLFMGGEFGQNDEWGVERSLDWHLVQYPEHAGLQRLVRDAQPSVPGRAGAVGAGLRLDRFPAGSTPTTPSTASCRSFGSRPTAAGARLCGQPHAGGARGLPGGPAQWRPLGRGDQHGPRRVRRERGMPTPKSSPTTCRGST